MFAHRCARTVWFTRKRWSHCNNHWESAYLLTAPFQSPHISIMARVRCNHYPIVWNEVLLFSFQHLVTAAVGSWTFILFLPMGILSHIVASKTDEEIIQRSINFWFRFEHLILEWAAECESSLKCNTHEHENAREHPVSNWWCQNPVKGKFGLMKIKSNCIPVLHLRVTFSAWRTIWRNHLRLQLEWVALIRVFMESRSFLTDPSTLTQIGQEWKS